MAVRDFTVVVDGFNTPSGARTLVRTVGEIMERFAIDHLLVDLMRDGEQAWAEAFDQAPVVLTGSTRWCVAFEERVRAAAERLVPEAQVSIDWSGHDPVTDDVVAANRSIERVARVFGGIGRGQVPARVRLAILNTDAYVARFGDSTGRLAAGRNERERPAKLALHALCDALGEAGASVGIDWKSGLTEAIAASDTVAFGTGMRRAAVVPPQFAGILAAVEAATAAEPARFDETVNWRALGAERDPSEPVNDAVHDVLTALSNEILVPDDLDPRQAAALDWCGELVTCP